MGREGVFFRCTLFLFFLSIHTWYPGWLDGWMDGVRVCMRGGQIYIQSGRQTGRLEVVIPTLIMARGVVCICEWKRGASMYVSRPRPNVFFIVRLFGIHSVSAGIKYLCICTVVFPISFFRQGWTGLAKDTRVGMMPNASFLLADQDNCLGMTCHLCCCLSDYTPPHVIPLLDLTPSYTIFLPPLQNPK